LRLREDFDGHAHPLPADVLFVAEVAETSLAYDRQEKIPRYAQELLPEVWFIDVAGETVTQYTQPDTMCYRREQVLERGQGIVAHTVSNLQLSTDSIFG
jgi:Uma2 family endonuclease